MNLLGARPDKRRSLRIAGVLLLLGVAFLIAGLTAVAVRAMAPVPQGPIWRPRPEPASVALDRPTVGSRAPVALTGWLSIVWGDGPPGSTRSSGPVYTLTDEGGHSIELVTGRLPARARGRLLALNGRRVAVRGSWQRVPVGDAGDPVFRVDVIEPDPASRAEAGPAADVVGSQPWISLLCKFSDVAAEPKALPYFQNMYGTAYPGLDHYWRELSYDAVDLLGSGATGWFTLPHPRSYYVYDMDSDGQLEFDHTAAANDCTAAADALVYFPDFVGINLMFNDDLDGYAWGGGRTMTLDGETRFWYMTWEPPWGYATIAVIAHEMGHGFGLPHSSGSYGQVYDNFWDVMSNAGSTCAVSDPVYGCLGQHTISFHKDLLGWIAAGYTYQATVNSQATIALERLALPLSGSYRMAQIPIGEAVDHFYTVEARKRVGYDGQLPGQAVIIHEVIGGHAYVLDPDGNGYTGDAGAMWVTGESFVDATYDITVTVEAETASGFTVTVAVAPQGGFTNCADQTEIPEAECSALEALYNSTDGPHWTSHSGWLDSAWPCSWNGVTCSGGAPRHVIELDLPNNGMAGPLPAQLGDLTALQFLDLSGNALTGGIPSSLAGLADLWALALYDNQLDGAIPSELGDLAQLEFLYLDQNGFTGNIPGELGGLSLLEELHLDANRLGGSIPAALGDLSTLRVLSLSYNQLGAVPTALADLTGLTSLDLGYNSLSTTDPGLVAFLNGKDPDWDLTQTVPPANLQVAAESLHSIELAWETIPYSSDGGYYEIGYATATGGPYTLHGTTAKTGTGYVAEGLLAGTPYYFAVRTYTPAHDVQQNDLWSEYTAEISGTTAGCATPAVPNLVTPENGSYTADSTPTFAWEVATASDGYDLQVDGDPGFASPEIDIATLGTAYTAGGSLADDTYTWHVRGHNTSDGCDTHGGWSDVWTVTVDTTPPGVPSLLSPEDGTSTADSTPTFAWSAPAGAVGYELQVDGDAGFGSPELEAAPVDSTYTPDQGLADGPYYWRVRARDTAGNWSDWSGAWTVTVDTSPQCAVPGTPGLVEPEDGRALADSTPLFEWDPASDADEYELQVDEQADFSSLEIAATTSSTSWTAGAPLADDVYSWRVRGHNTSQGCDRVGAWSSVWIVTVDTTAPTGSILINSGDPYTLDPMVSLSLVASDNVAVPEMNLRYNGAWQGWEAFATSRGITLEGGEGLHTVEVRYRDNAGNTSPVYSDTIVLDTVPPAVPGLLSPADGMVTEDRTPAFDWSVSAGATDYQLQVDRGATFGSPVIDLTTASPPYAPNAPLPLGAYHWRVRAQDAAGNWSAWSSSWMLEIDAGWDFILFLPSILSHE